MNVSRLDMRIGKIVGVKYHPNADTLYIEQSEHHIRHAHVCTYVHLIFIAARVEEGWGRGSRVCM